MQQAWTWMSAYSAGVVVIKDVFSSRDKNQYLAPQGILSDMWAFLETATAETREQVQQVLEDITDLSSDEDSPTINTGGHQVAMNSRLSTTIATAFVHGIATSNLCGCDMENPKASEGDMVSFSRHWFWLCHQWPWGDTHGTGCANQSCQ